MTQEDQDRNDVLNSIADRYVKNVFAYSVILVFLGAAGKLIFFTSNWQEMSSMGAFNVIVMWVLKYYFPQVKKA